MQLTEVYNRLAERHQTLQEKLTELISAAEEIAGAQRQFQRVEAERYETLCQELDSAFDDHTRARQRFARALQGE